MDLKENLFFYAKALILFILVLVLSNEFLKRGVNDNHRLLQIGYFVYWGLIFLADTIKNKK